MFFLWLSIASSYITLAFLDSQVCMCTHAYMSSSTWKAASMTECNGSTSGCPQCTHLNEGRGGFCEETIRERAETADRKTYENLWVLFLLSSHGSHCYHFCTRSIGAWRCFILLCVCVFKVAGLFGKARGIFIEALCFLWGKIGFINFDCCIWMFYFRRGPSVISMEMAYFFLSPTTQQHPLQK